jgi:hypothetical protein
MTDKVVPLIPKVQSAFRIEWWVCADPNCKALHVGLKTEDDKWIATNTVSRDSLVRMLAFLDAEKP